MPMTVQNNEPNVTAFAKTVQGDNVRITWGAKGQPDDTKRVPDAFADDIDFLNSVESGIFTVLDGPPDVLDKIKVESAQAETLRNQQRERAAASTEQMMDRQQDKSMLGASCIGPGVRPDLPCGRTLLIPHTKINQVPPLCEQHQDLAPTFSLVEAGSKGEGATESRDGVVRREWRQATLMPAVRGS